MTDAKFDIKCAQVSSLLDELRSSSNNRLDRLKIIGKFISHDFSSNEQDLKKVVTTIFKNLVKKPDNCSDVAELCSFQVYYENENHNGRRRFAKELIEQTQYLFEKKQERIYEIFGVGEEEKFIEFRPWLMVFIGFLYRYQFFSLKIINICLSQTIGNEVNNNVDQKSFLCGLIITDVIANLDPTWRREKTELHAQLDQWLSEIYPLRHCLAKSNQFAFADLMELKKNEWIRDKKYHYVRLVQAYSKIEDEEKDEKYHIVQRNLKKFLDENSCDIKVMNSEIRKIRCEIVKKLKDNDLEKLVCPIVSLYDEK